MASTADAVCAAPWGPCCRGWRGCRGSRLWTPTLPAPCPQLGEPSLLTKLGGSPSARPPGAPWGWGVCASDAPGEVTLVAQRLLLCVPPIPTGTRWPRKGPFVGLQPEWWGRCRAGPGGVGVGVLGGARPQSAAGGLPQPSGAVLGSYVDYT